MTKVWRRYDECLVPKKVVILRHTFVIPSSYFRRTIAKNIVILQYNEPCKQCLNVPLPSGGQQFLAPRPPSCCYPFSCMHRTHIYFLLGARLVVYCLATTIYESISICPNSLHNYHSFCNSMTQVWRRYDEFLVSKKVVMLRRTFVITSSYYCKNLCISAVEWTMQTVLAVTVATWWPTVPFTSSSLMLLSTFMHPNISYIIYLLSGARPTVYCLVTTIYESISTCSISLHNYHCFFNSITKVWRICGVKGVRHTSSYLRHTFVIPSLYYCKSQCNSTVEWTIQTVLAHTVAIWWPTVPFTSSSLLLLSIFVHSSYPYLPFIMHESNVYC